MYESEISLPSQIGYTRYNKRAISRELSKMYKRRYKFERSYSNSNEGYYLAIIFVILCFALNFLRVFFI